MSLSSWEKSDLVEPKQFLSQFIQVGKGFGQRSSPFQLEGDTSPQVSPSKGPTYSVPVSHLEGDNSSSLSQSVSDRALYKASGAAKKVISSFISSLKYSSNWEAAEAGQDVGHDIKPGRDNTILYPVQKWKLDAGSWTLEAGHEMKPGRDNSVAPTKIYLPSKSPRALCWSTRPVQTNKNQSSFKLKVTIVVILRFNSNWFVIFVITSIIITINDLIHVCCQTYIANATNINLRNSRNSTKLMQQIWNQTDAIQATQCN